MGTTSASDTIAPRARAAISSSTASVWLSVRARRPSTGSDPLRVKNTSRTRACRRAGGRTERHPERISKMTLPATSLPMTSPRSTKLIPVALATAPTDIPDWPPTENEARTILALEPMIGSKNRRSDPLRASPRATSRTPPRRHKSLRICKRLTSRIALAGLPNPAVRPPDLTIRRKQERNLFFYEP